MKVKIPAFPQASIRWMSCSGDWNPPCSISHDLRAASGLPDDLRNQWVSILSLCLCLFLSWSMKKRILGWECVNLYCFLMLYKMADARCKLFMFRCFRVSVSNWFGVEMGWAHRTHYCQESRQAVSGCNRLKHWCSIRSIIFVKCSDISEIPIDFFLNLTQ